MWATDLIGSLSGLLRPFVGIAAFITVPLIEKVGLKIPVVEHLIRLAAEVLWVLFSGVLTIGSALWKILPGPLQLLVGFPGVAVAVVGLVGLKLVGSAPFGDSGSQESREATLTNWPGESSGS